MPADDHTDEAKQKAAVPKATEKETHGSAKLKESGLSRLASSIAIATFFFGVGNFTDLWHHFLHDDAPQAQMKHSMTVTGYFGRVEGSACPAHPAFSSKDVSVAWLNQTLNDRITFTDKWPDPDLEQGLTSTDEAEIRSAVRQFNVATAFWAALPADVKAHDVSAYNAHVGQYRQAMAGYRAALAPYTPFGCIGAWPDLPVWRTS